MNIINNHIFITSILIIVINIFAFLYSYLFVKLKIGNSTTIQKKEVRPDLNYLISHTPRFLVNVASLILLSGAGLYFFYDYIIDINKTSIAHIVIPVFIIFIIDDIFFYFVHRLIHVNKFLYKKIHRIHHEANMPIAIDYIYAHPLEWMVGYIGPFIGILLYGGISIYTFWLYLIIRNMHEIFIHSGINSSSFLYKIIPFAADNKHHDLHHEKYNCNYASTFTFWDRVFKTQLK